MKQNSDNIPGSLIGQIKLFRVRLNSLGLPYKWEFNLSYMPNPLDKNKIKVVRVFDSVCTDTVRNLAE